MIKSLLYELFHQFIWIPVQLTSVENVHVFISIVNSILQLNFKSNFKI